MSLRNVSLSAKACMMVVLALAIFGVTLASISISIATESIENQVKARLEANIAFGKFLLEQHGSTYKIQDNKLYVGDHILNDDEEIVDRISKLGHGVMTIFQGDLRIATNVMKPDGQRANGTRLAAGVVYDTVLKDGKAYEGEAEVLGQKVLGSYEPIKDPSGNVLGVMFAGMDKSEQMKAVNSLIQSVALSAIGIVLVVCFCIYIVLRRMLAPLGDMTVVMSALQREDTSIDVPAQERGDEVGHIARAVQSFKESLIQTIKLRSEFEAQKKQAEVDRHNSMLRMADDFDASVKGVVATVSSAATEMQSSAKTMAGIADSTSNKSSAVAAAAEQASSNIQTVASAAEELNSSIEEINRQIGDSVRVASACVIEAESTGHVMESLSKSAADIGEVVKLIEYIASQVNLLALNATIEAARAGEAGRGFAVVANEVKNLANQVGNAAQSITRQVSGIQTQTKEAVETISSITSTIKKINEISTAIAAAVEEQGSATKEISRSIQETAQGTNEVTTNIHGVTQSVAETSTASGQLFDTATQLSRESETLRTVVENFIAHVRES